MPPSPVGADFELGRERALGNLAVDGGSGQPGPGKDSFQTDDTVWFAHGRAASCSLFLTTAETDRAGIQGHARGFYQSPYCGEESAVNRMGQIPMLRPLPRSMPWVKANSWPSRRPDSNAIAVERAFRCVDGDAVVIDAQAVALSGSSLRTNGRKRSFWIPLS